MRRTVFQKKKKGQNGQCAEVKINFTIFGTFAPFPKPVMGNNKKVELSLVWLFKHQVKKYSS